MCWFPGCDDLELHVDLGGRTTFCLVGALPLRDLELGGVLPGPPLLSLISPLSDELGGLGGGLSLGLKITTSKTITPITASAITMIRIILFEGAICQSSMFNLYG